MIQLDPHLLPMKTPGITTWEWIETIHSHVFCSPLAVLSISELNLLWPDLKAPQTSAVTNTSSPSISMIFTATVVGPSGAGSW
jgi:hypothetical protein